MPVKDQKEITGHAVRAMYMYTGAADVAAVTGSHAYMNAMKTVWEDVVYRNMYITGGIGSSGSNEGFSVDYDLPNENAYCETCASVGMVFWNQRMNLLTGDAKYIDVLERSLYNAALDGLSLSGDRFFYGNPLASRGQHFRREWFGTACCPSNIARLISSLGGYIYGKFINGIWVNLFVESNTIIKIGKSNVNINIETNYPWDGKVRLNIDPEKKTKFDLHIRIPGWSEGIGVPGDLYKSKSESKTSKIFFVNGKSFSYKIENGYAVLNKEWKKGDKVEAEFFMEVQSILSKSEVKQNENRVAVQRGPLVYCVEGVDNNNQVWNILVPDNTEFKEITYSILSEPIIALQAELPVITSSADSTTAQTKNKKIIFIPYYTWANRGQNPMQVWFPQKIKDIKVNY